uniref:Major facilitator superfamily (MFS) profile domain-containing protein n=2 Tax=Clastoptera arizonana TaxID=38151 RepID=A0A1B6CPJ0_9HEMI
MEPWVKVSLLLCGFGILKEFRPSEPYIIQYLITPPMNFTEQQVNQDIFPVSTYSHMLSLIVVFLITDYLRYKVIIIIDALCGVIVYLLLIFGRTVFLMQVLEVFYGLFMAGEVAYYTYIYAKVDKEHFQAVTSFTRSAYLAGRAICGLVAQIIVTFNIATYMGLQWLTLGGLSLALFWAIFLPKVERSIYFHRDKGDLQPTLKTPISNGFRGKTKNSEESSTEEIDSKSSAINYIWTDLTSAFTNLYVVKWAFWWALATCGNYMVISYVQLLWQAIRVDTNSSETQYNGLVETVYTLLGAVASMLMGRLKVDWRSKGEAVLTMCSIGLGIALFVMSQTYSMAVAYVLFIVFTIVYQIMMTVANFEVAKNINDDSYGLIFGVTTFIALVIQSVFMFVLNTKLALPARMLFTVYGCYFSILGIVFLFAILARLLHKVFRSNNNRYNF